MVVRPSSGAGSNAPEVAKPEVKNSGQMDVESVLNDPFKYLNEYIKKKIRNLEKRKGKLDGYKEKLKKGETLTKDQQEAVNKFEEVSGMLSFANELVSHLTSVDGSAKKERKKRARRDQLKAENERLELVTRALEMFTLMHLTEPDDKIVTPLRERTSFHPSPGAHLNQFAAGTAKLLINLCDTEKEETELFINEEEGHVKYQQVKEKLELIRPKYNPVPDYGDEGSDYTPEADEIDPALESVRPDTVESKEEDEEEILESDGFENGIETEASSPLVEINGIEEAQNGSEDGYVSIQHAALPEPEVIQANPEDPADNLDDIEFVENVENVDETEIVQIPTTMEFINREAFGEEDKIKEILVEVSSGFNFLAPPDEEEDFDEEKELTNELGLSFGPAAGSGVEFRTAEIPEVDSGSTVPVHTVPDETVSFENSNFENNFEKMDLKDEPTWQQRQHQNGTNGNGNARQDTRQVYRNTNPGHTNTSYRNSQRYQRNFENRRPNNGAGEFANQIGDQGSHRNVKPMRGHPTGPHPGQNGAFPKRSNFTDNRRGAKP